MNLSDVTPARPDTALGACLAPRAIAVIGVGRTGGVGYNIFQNLRASYRGRLYPVNLHAPSIDGVKAFASVSEIPDAVDLAVIAIPAAAVDAALDDCVRAWCEEWSSSAPASPKWVARLVRRRSRSASGRQVCS